MESVLLALSLFSSEGDFQSTKVISFASFQACEQYAESMAHPAKGVLSKTCVSREAYCKAHDCSNIEMP